jgi:transmembrane sensor
MSDAAIASQVLREAADWFASLADPAAGETERRRWSEWNDAHPDHAEAWRRVEGVTRNLTPLAAAGDIARHVLEKPHRNGRRKMLGRLAVLAVTGGGALAAARLPWSEWRHDYALARAGYRTALGETRAYTLTDGGRIWLGSRGALDVDYSPALRRLALHDGDLLAETARDANRPARPFVVDTRHGRLRALGTRFAVRADAQTTRLDVFEGAVEIAPRGAAPRVIPAGEQAAFDDGGIRATGAAQAARSAWTRGILIADGLRLDELAAELARWHALPVVCEPATAGLRVVGAYPLQDLPRIFAALEASLPVAVQRDAQAARIVSARPAPMEGLFTEGPFTPPRPLPR